MTNGGTAILVTHLLALIWWYKVKFPKKIEMIGNVPKNVYVYFGAYRIQCGEINIGGWILPP